MNYELAKQLYNAGFPTIYWQHLDLGNRQLETEDVMNGIPTLSELIEACDTGFKFELVHAQAGWFTRTRGESIDSCKTPEEAVASLYIALNTKKNG